LELAGIAYFVWEENAVTVGMGRPTILNKSLRLEKRDAMDAPEFIDASTFQKPLAELALTMSLKVEREGSSLLTPAYVPVDIGVLLRMSNETLNLLWFVNADETQKSAGGRPIYSIASLPLVRTLIDNLYNITFILRDPANHGRAYRLSGIKKEQRDLNEDEQRYGGKPEWDAWLTESREKIDLQMRSLKFTQTEVDAQSDWMTFGKYVRQKGPGGTLNDHQTFLSTFQYGPWREYSALSHGGPEALRDVGMFYTYKEQPFEDRPKIDDALERTRSLHLMRASLVLLVTITELQLFFHFSDANIDSRLHQVWNAMLIQIETIELYSDRYKDLLEKRGIRP
jgi:hypothetical protein